MSTERLIFILILYSFTLGCSKLTYTEVEFLSTLPSVVAPTIIANQDTIPGNPNIGIPIPGDVSVNDIANSTCLPVTYSAGICTNCSVTGTLPNITLTPTAAGAFSFAHTATCNDGITSSSTTATGTAVVTPSILAVQDVVPGNSNTGEGILLNLSTNDIPNSTCLPVTYSAGTCTNCSVTGTLPNVTLTPTAAGAFSFAHTATCDDGTTSSSTTATGTAVIPPSVLANQDIIPGSPYAGAAIIFDVSANDVANASCTPVTYAGAICNNCTNITALPNVTLTPTNPGVFSFYHTATCSDGTTSSGTTINGTAVAAPSILANADVVPGTPDVGIGIPINLSTNDVANSTCLPVTYSAGICTNCSVTGTLPNVTLTPTAAGAFSFAHTATCNDGTTVSSTTAHGSTIPTPSILAVEDIIPGSPFAEVGIQLNVSINDVSNAICRPVSYTSGVCTNCSVTGSLPNINLTPTTPGAFSFPYTATCDDGTTSSSTTVNGVAVVPPPSIIANQDVIFGTSEIGIGIPVNVSTNDVANSTCLPVSYTGGACTNCTASGTLPNVTLTPTAAGAFSFAHTATCDDGLTTSSTIANGIATTTQDFVSLWNFPTNNFNFTLPLKQIGASNYNFTVDWGDGSPIDTVTSFGDVDKNHTYLTAGNYTITISGSCEGFQNNGAFRDNLLEVPNLGSVGWRNLSNAFENNSNLGNLYGGDTSQVIDMSRMFSQSPLANPDTSGWDTSSNTTFLRTFWNADAANPDTSNWDTSSVRDMGFMFYQTAIANPDTSNWDTSEVLGFSYMFAQTLLADPDTSNWDTSNALGANGMFENARVANPDTTWWDMSNVFQANHMFTNATAANPNTTNWVLTSMQDMSAMFRWNDVANPNTTYWDTSRVRYMGHMFGSTALANPDTSNWDTSRVIDMGHMFNDALSANPNTTNWDTSSVTTMWRMFWNAPLANPDTANWNTSSVRNMEEMFRNAPLANPDTTNWNTSRVITMHQMFRDAPLANPDTTNWDTGLVNNFSQMFQNAISANPNITNWDTSSATRMSYMLDGATLANPNVGNLSLVGVPNLQGFMRGNTGLSTNNYNIMLNRFRDAEIMTGNIETTAQYDAAVAGAARAWLAARFWFITDGGSL